MTGGVSIEYAHARASARLGERPDERLWHQLRASRRVRVLLDAVRASSAAAYVSGIEPLASPDAIELAFRQQFRLRVDEVARWAPDAWVPAVRWTRVLVDLPALLHLAGGAPDLTWMKVDPELFAYALPSRPERQAALAAGPLAPLAQVLVDNADDAHGARALHPVVETWKQHWRSLWAPTSADEQANLEALVRLLERHERDFAGLAVEEAAEARLALAARVSSVMRRAAAQPAALFGWLAVLALDLERLRTEFMSRALEEAEAF